MGPRKLPSCWSSSSSGSHGSVSVSAAAVAAGPSLPEGNTAPRLSTKSLEALQVYHRWTSTAVQNGPSCQSSRSRAVGQRGASRCTDGDPSAKGEVLRREKDQTCEKPSLANRKRGPNRAGPHDPPWPRPIPTTPSFHNRPLCVTLGEGPGVVWAETTPCPTPAPSVPNASMDDEGELGPRSDSGRTVLTPPLPSPSEIYDRHQRAHGWRKNQWVPLSVNPSFSRRDTRSGPRQALVRGPLVSVPRTLRRKPPPLLPRSDPKTTS